MSTKVGTAILDIRTDIGQVLSNMKALERELGGVRSSVKETSTSLAGLGKFLAGAFTATAILSAGKQVLDYAGHVSDLAARLQISTTAVQQWESAFGPAGISIDTVAKAAGELSAKLVGGDKSAVAALQKMGLSVEQLKAMKPEERFTLVADAVGKLQNDAERLYASKTLFGKGGVELLAALDGHLTETIDRMTELGLVIDEETIKAADDFGDQLGFLGKQLLGIVATVIGPLLPALSALGNVLSWLGRNVIGPVLNVAVKGAMTALASLWISVAEIVGKIADLGSKLPGVGNKFAELGTWLRKSADQTGNYVANLWTQRDATDAAGDAAAKAAPKLIGLGGASEEGAKKAKKQAEELAKLRDRIREIEFSAAANRFANAYDPSAGEQPEVVRLRAYLAGLEKVREVEAEIAAGGARGLENLGRVLNIDALKQQIATLDEFAATDFRNVMSRAIGSLPDLLQRAFTGGGGLNGAIQALTSQIGGGIGAGLFKAGGLLNGLGNKLAGIFGDSFGLALPGIGQALGALVGPALAKLWDGLKRAFGGPSKEELAGRDLLAGFQGRFKSFEDMVERVGEAYRATGRTSEQAQRDVKALLDATRQGPEAVQAWIDKLNEVFDEQERRTEAVADAMVDLETAVANAGGRIPSHLRPMVERLIELGNLTDAQKQKLRELLDAGPNFDALEKEASEFGITLDALGPQFQQAHINDEGNRILSLFTRLEDAGADVGGVLLGMSDEVSALVQQAMRYGSTLPEGLRPILENLAAAGKLTDENGNKIEDLSGLSFAETPLDKSSQAIVDAIDKLRELFEDMPGIARASADGVSRALDGIEDPEITGRVRWELDPMPGMPEIDGSFRITDGIPMARGGYGRVTRETPFIVGEAGAEDVVFGGAGRNLAQDIARELAGVLPEGGQATELINHNYVYLDGQRVAENTTRRIVLGKGGLDRALRQTLVPA